MANTNAPFGFLPSRHMRGGVIRMNALGQYLMASGLASNLFAGDVVKGSASGPYVDVAANTDAALLGVWAGVQFINPLDLRPWWTDYWASGQTTVSSLDANAFLFDDPDVIFYVQCKTGTNFALTHVNNNAKLSTTTAGSTITRRSGMALDISGVTTGSDQFRILNLTPIPGNVVGDSAIVDVRFNLNLNYNYPQTGI